MNSQGWNDATFRDLLEQSMSSAGTNDANYDIEDLVLLAEGRVDELDDDRRSRLFDAIAASPEAGTLVLELQRLGIGEAAGAARRPAASGWTLRVLLGTWAAAACLLLSLAVWRTADPPAPLMTNGTIDTLNAKPEEVDYWAQLDEQRRMARVERDEWRDLALLATSGACLALSIGIVGCVFWRRATHPTPAVTPRAPDAD